MVRTALVLLAVWAVAQGAAGERLAPGRELLQATAGASSTGIAVGSPGQSASASAGSAATATSYRPAQSEDSAHTLGGPRRTAKRAVRSMYKSSSPIAYLFIGPQSSPDA